MNFPVLDLDIGNTRLKFRYRDVSGSTIEGAVPHGAEELESGKLRDFAPARVRVASVAGADVLQRVLDFCRQHWQVEPELAGVRETCAGVRQGYADKQRLGVDRWLAVLAAYNTAGAASVVVSCGTAITVDLVTAGGEHLGGYIVPGFDLMRGALFERTSAVKLEQLQRPQTLAPGKDTFAAVNHGLILMVKSLVESAGHELGEGADARIIVTGGDGELLLPFLAESSWSTNVQYRPNLVLDGLALALP
jgi:type III pantothenate kinase